MRLMCSLCSRRVAERFCLYTIDSEGILQNIQCLLVLFDDVPIPTVSYLDTLRIV